MLASSGHGHMEQNQGVPLKVGAIVVYSAILFLYELKATFSRWLGNIQRLTQPNGKSTRQKVQIALPGKINTKEKRG